MARYNTFLKKCLQCEKDLITTSNREKVHAACREEYYKDYQKKLYRNKVKVEVSNASRNRQRYFVNNQVCASCGFTALTKNKGFLNPLTGKSEEYYLCSNCLALWRCGMLKAFSWERIDTCV